MKKAKQMLMVLLCFLMILIPMRKVYADEAWSEGNEGDFIGVNGWTAFGHGEHIYVDGDDAFCINNHEDFVGGQTVAMDPEDLGLSQNDARFLSLIQYYAQSAYGWGMAQNCIWIYLHGSSGIHFFIETGGASSFEDCISTYNEIYAKAWSYMYERPSFENNEVELIIGETTSLADSNGVLNDYQVTSSSSSVEVSIEGNSLKLKGISPTDDFVTLSFTHKVSSRLTGANIVWQLSGQNVGCFRYADPANFAIRVKVIGGVAVIEKIDEFDEPTSYGTVFSLYEAIEDENGTVTGSDGKTYSMGEFIKQSQSNEEGIITIGADEGNYFLKETSAANPYRIDDGTTRIRTWFPVYDEENEVWLDGDPAKEKTSSSFGTAAYIELRLGAKTYVSCRNDLRSISFDVYKVDEEENYRKINDAVFTVYDVSSVLDVGNRESEELFFVKKGKTIDLREYLFESDENLKDEIDGRPIRFELEFSNMGTVGFDGTFTPSKTGITSVTAKGGSYTLFASDINKEISVGSEFDPYDIEFFADEDARVKIEVEEISYEGEMDLSSTGTFTLLYHMISKQGVLYEFERKIEVKPAKHECVYDAISDAYIYADDKTACEVIPIEKPLTRVISEAIVSNTEEDFEGKELGSFKLHIVLDDDELSLADCFSYEALKLFEGASGHSYIQTCDPYDHDRYIPFAEVTLYHDEELKIPFRSYLSDELGMVDLLKDDFSELESIEGDDGIYYYSNGLVIRTVTLNKQEDGKLQIDHLKHSREYLICETSLPEGYDYGETSSCMLLKTKEYGEGIENGDITLTNLKRRLDVVLYKTNASYSLKLNGAIFDVWDIHEEGSDLNVIKGEKQVLLSNQGSEYIPLSLGKTSFSETDESGLSLFATDYDIEDLIIVDSDGDEFPSADFIRKHMGEDGVMDNEADVYSFYKADSIERKYLGRYVSGGFYKVFDSDAEVVEVSSDKDFTEIILTKKPDESGAVIISGLSDGRYYIRKQGDIEAESFYVSQGMILLPEIIYGHELEFKEIKAPEGYHFDESTFVLRPLSPYGIDRIENYRKNDLTLLPKTSAPLKSFAAAR